MVNFFQELTMYSVCFSVWAVLQNQNTAQNSVRFSICLSGYFVLLFLIVCLLVCTYVRMYVCIFVCLFVCVLGTLYESFGWIFCGAQKASNFCHPARYDV